MHRIIYSLKFEMPPPPGVHSRYLNVPLLRNGQPGGSSSSTNGRPRPPVKRTVDLRVGDEILLSDQWQKILSIEVTSDSWVTDEHAATMSAEGHGYVYRPKVQPEQMPLSATTDGGLRREA